MVVLEFSLETVQLCSPWCTVTSALELYDQSIDHERVAFTVSIIGTSMAWLKRCSS